MFRPVVLLFLFASCSAAYESNGIVPVEFLAPEGSAPYHASLQGLDDSLHICGASIISTRWLLTAARCVDPRYSHNNQLDFKVVVGTNILAEGEGTTYDVDKVIVHSEFHHHKYRDDIAFVKVTEDIILSEKVQLIKLSDKHYGDDVDLKHTGWGTVMYLNENGSPVLRELHTKSYQQEICGDRFTVTEEQRKKYICALAPKGQGACHGDTGGPLVDNGTQVGIKVWSVSCSVPYPDIYTRVAPYYEWIQKIIKEGS